MDPADAVDSPRLHLEGRHLDFEDLLDAATKASLLEAFEDRTVWPDRNMFFGGVHAALRRADGALLGAGDSRRAGESVEV